MTVDIVEHTPERMVLNMGPQHPSTHGVLRLVLELEGETIRDVRPVIGYLHTGIEKTAEQLPWQQALVVTDRMDYLGPLICNLGYSLAVEKLLDLEIPRRAQIARVCLCELQRIASHLVWLGTHGLDLGALSVFLYGFRDRESLLDIFEECAGVRMMTSYINVGGLRYDLPEKFEELVRAFLAEFPDRLAEYHALLTENPIWLERTQGLGVLTVEEALDLGVTGPTLRACGFGWDLRREEPYSLYDEFDFDVPVGEHGDIYDRYLVRLAEMEQSCRIVAQALEKLEPGPVRTPDLKVTLPDRRKLHKSMESLIHHFMLVCDGFAVPAGEVYVPIESPRGELGFYMVSDGGHRPYRMHYRGPSYFNVQSLSVLARGRLVADLVALIASVDIMLGDIDR